MLISYINNSKNGYKKPDNLQSGQIQKTDLQKDVFVSRESRKKELTKQEKIQKLADVGVCATFIAVFLYEIYKNQYSAVKKLAKNIEFTPANSVDEAIKFGKKVLGIEEYIGFKNNDIDGIYYFGMCIYNIICCYHITIDEGFNSRHISNSINIYYISVGYKDYELDF